jgi:hypothetical protein
VTYEEKFIDNDTKHVRQNEHTLYMDDIDSIIGMAIKVGFSLKGKMNMAKVQKKPAIHLQNPYADENQYLYIFERLM